VFAAAGAELRDDADAAPVGGVGRFLDGDGGGAVPRVGAVARCLQSVTETGLPERLDL